MSPSPLAATVALMSALVTPSTLGLLFEDGFESGGPFAWSNLVGNDWTVNTAAALDGSFGFRVFPSSSTSATTYVVSTHPDAESEYRASFLFRWTALNNPIVDIFHARSAQPSSTFNLRFFPPALFFVTPGPQLSIQTCIAPDATHEIEIRWRSPAPGLPGTLQLWVNGSLAVVMDPSLLSQTTIDEVRLGAASPLLSSAGHMDFDRFESDTEIPAGPDPVFAHGFECGDTQGWSQTVP